MNIEAQQTQIEPQSPRTPVQKSNLWKTSLVRILDNPVILKELRGRMRGRQAFILLSIYLGLIALFIGILYTFLAREISSVSPDPNSRQMLGKVIFGAVVLLELLLVSFIGPGLTSGAISSERERKTFDLLRTTLLSASALVLGKLGSAFTYLFLLILTTLPIQSLAFLLGGVGMAEMVVSSIMLIVTALFFCTLGIFFSSFMKRTLPATLSSYGSILLSILVVALISFLLSFLESGSSLSKARESMITLIVWFLISTNPFAAAIVSEVILVDEQNLFFTHSSPFGNTNITLPSPWIIFVVVYLLLITMMIFIAILRVKRPDR